MARRLLNPNGIAALAGAAEYNVTKLASRVCLSRRQLYRLVRDRFDQSPHELLARQKIESAEALLRSGMLSKNVAAALSYTSVTNFSRWFKEKTNLTPRQFARQAAAEDAARRRDATSRLSFKMPLAALCGEIAAGSSTAARPDRCGSRGLNGPN